ncbi:MAG TPA: class I SAM-dependent methyltransferase [Blastocatellia bacterium]|nr:class I SAM-dependent methyltransferase [Blastocatellia bacterium]
MDKIYTFDYLRSLFNEMASSYDRVNYLTSFGFSQRFRREFIRKASLEPGNVVCDLMCGRGECWPFILNGIGHSGKLFALDLSPGMLEGARRRLSGYSDSKVVVIEGNALSTGLADSSVDRIVIAFGLKTLAEEFRPGLAAELFRLLRPGGLISAIEMSEPRGWWLRPLFMWYLKSIVPILGRVLLGNPANYRMLGVYTERFQGCQYVVDAMREAGLEAEPVTYFHGCATGILARKPRLLNDDRDHALK